MGSPAHLFKTCSCGNCPICDWGMDECTRCGAVEGELTSECPGYEVSRDTRDRVFSGELDFKGGKWIDPRTGEEVGEHVN